MAPMPLVTYEQTRPFARAIADAASQRKMPPWFADPGIGHFSNDPSLSPRKSPRLLPGQTRMRPRAIRMMLRRRANGRRDGSFRSRTSWCRCRNRWRFPRSGDVEYTYEIVHTGFTEGKWVQFSEVRPSSRENVHHAVVYVRPPDSHWLQHAPIGVPFTGADMSDEQDRNDTHFTTADILLVYAPGSSPDNWANGMAKYIPGGLRPGVPDALHGARAPDERSDQRRHGVREAASRRSACSRCN